MPAHPERADGVVARVDGEQQPAVPGELDAALVVHDREPERRRRCRTEPSGRYPRLLGDGPVRRTPVHDDGVAGWILGLRVDGSTAVLFAVVSVLLTVLAVRAGQHRRR